MREKNNTNLERMRELIERLTEADIAYYKNDAPIMTDLEYDRLTEELASLEHDTGLVLSGSPTQKVSGEILENLAEVRHTKPMLSAGKTKSIEDLIRFAAGRAVLLSWKMDGLTLVLRYEYGKLKQAITRGREGIIGEDVTHVPFPVSWTVKMKKKQKETQDILSYHTQAAGCSDKARAKASGGRQPIEECGRTGL